MDSTEAQKVIEALQINVPRPPASFVSWLTLVGLLLAVGGGGVGYGVLLNKVETLSGLASRVAALELTASAREQRLDSLEAFQPLTVDRRLGAVEGKLGSIEGQLSEVLRQLRMKPNKGEGEER